MSAFRRKIEEFDPSQFGNDPFDDVESPEERDLEDLDDPIQKLGECLGYAIVAVILGILGRKIFGF